jgi:peptidoglycan-associated lipoprotein
MKHFNPIALSLVVACAVLAGCASPSKETSVAAAPVETRSPVSTAPAVSTAPVGGAAAAGAAQSGVSTVNLGTRGTTAGAGAAGAALLAARTQRIVYFDFDSFVIKDEFKGLLDSHAKVLTRSTGKRMVIEGHTDERGGREYNLALGQKRADAVRKALSLLGVSEPQMESVSFGKEKPAASGEDEVAYAKNRRVEISYR